MIPKPEQLQEFVDGAIKGEKPLHAYARRCRQLCGDWLEADETLEYSRAGTVSTNLIPMFETREQKARSQLTTAVELLCETLKETQS